MPASAIPVVILVVAAVAVFMCALGGGAAWSNARPK